MSGIEATGPQNEFTGSAIIRDFRLAMVIAEDIGQFESWALHLGRGVDKEVAITAIQNDPVNHPGVLTSGEGLGSLLSSHEEQAKMEELSEKSRMLNLDRFIGKEATFRSDVVGPIKRYVRAASYDGNDRMVPSGAPRHAVVTSDITSFLPAAGVIRIGEDSRQSKYTDIEPFHSQTGKQVVQITLTK